MKYRYIFVLLVLMTNLVSAQEDESVFIKKIFDNALTNQQAYHNLEYLCTNAPGRLLGTENSLAALEYMKQYFEKTGADSVFLQEFRTPAWKCDSSSVFILPASGKAIRLHSDALGPSPSTPAEGIMAEVIEVKSLAEVEKLGKEVISGKIVFFNRKFLNTNR